MPRLSTVDVAEVLTDTWKQFSTELVETPLPHFNESVFRFLFVRSLLRKYPNARCETEWKRCDLLFFDSIGPTVVEFKFYVHNYHRSLSGKTQYRKGGAGEKNFDEFCRCVEKLSALDSQKWGKDYGSHIKNRFLILAYADAEEHDGRKSYGAWYDSLSLPDRITNSTEVVGLAQFQDAVCPATKHRMRCSLFRVRSRMEPE